MVEARQGGSELDFADAEQSAFARRRDRGQRHPGWDLRTMAALGAGGVKMNLLRVVVRTIVGGGVIVVSRSKRRRPN